MQCKQPFRRLRLNFISRAATAILAIAVVFALTVVMSPLAQAQKPATSVAWPEKVLFSFNGTDGSGPTAGLIFDAAGNLYGTTSGGGTHGVGTVFELTPTAGGGWTEKELYNFCSQDNCTDGGRPVAGLIFDAAGNLYGTTNGGGSYRGGTVFELTSTAGGGWAETVLHSFNCFSVADGCAPLAGLIFDAAGNLYGTTSQGGAYNGGNCSSTGCGTVFELTPTEGGGWTEQVLHNFGNSTDGNAPYAGLIFDAAGNLYGTTLFGGTYGFGTVFELTPAGAETVLHSFNPYNGTDGYYPYAGLILDAAGNLYGTTFYGGTYGVGTVFELTPTAGGGWTEKELYNFCSQDNCTDGGTPYAALIFGAGGDLYGTTEGGGTYGSGTVVELMAAAGGWTEKVLYSFCAQSNCPDGAAPYAGLIFDATGNLYGTTFLGGVHTNGNGWGTVFELTPVYPCARCSQRALHEGDVLPAEGRDVLELEQEQERDRTN